MSSQATIDEPRADKEVCIEDLAFVRIKIPENVRLIPKELVDSVKGKIFSVEDFYKYQEQQIGHHNPGNFLYVLIDKNKKIEGYLWIEISQIDLTMFINTFSISKEYWHKGKAIPKVVEFLERLQAQFESPKVLWITTNDKFFAKHGFKRSKNVLMEYNKD